LGHALSASKIDHQFFSKNYAII